MTKQLEQEPQTLEYHLGRTLARLKDLEGRTLTGEEQEKYARLQKNASVIRRGVVLREERTRATLGAIEARAQDPEGDLEDVHEYHPFRRTLRVLTLTGRL
jgi:hypothetical protein